MADSADFDYRSALKELLATDNGERFSHLREQQEQAEARRRVQQTGLVNYPYTSAPSNSSSPEQALSDAKAELAQREHMRPLPGRQKSKLQRSATDTALERKPSKLGQVVGGLFSGLDVRARPWEAKSEELLNLQRAKENLERKQTRDAEDIKVLEALVKDMKLGSGKDSDLVGLLSATIEQKASAADMKKKLELLKAGKSVRDADKEELSLAEQERLAHMEWEAQRLTVVKLQLARREEARKELAAMQEKLKTLGVPARIVSDELEEETRRYHDDDEHGEFFHTDDDLFGEDLFGPSQHSASFHQDQQWRGQPGPPRRATTLDGRGRGRDAPAFDEPMFASKEGYFDEPSGSHEGGQFPGRSGRSRRAEHNFFGKTHPSHFADDVTFPRGGAGSLPFQQDRRQQPRRAQTMKAVDPRALPIDRSDPRLDKRSPLYDKALALAFLEREEGKRRGDVLAGQQERENLQRQTLYNVQNTARREKELSQGLRRREEQTKVNAAKELSHAREQADLRGQRAEIDAYEDRVNRMEEQNKLENRKRLEELDRLEKLLAENPHSAIQGLDMKEMLNDPQALEKALKQVETNTRVGILPFTQVQPSRPARRPLPHIDQNLRHHIQHFLRINYAQQQAYLARMPNPDVGRDFVQAAMSILPQEEARQLYDRYHIIHYDLDEPDGYQQPAESSRMHRTDPVIDRMRSPPPTQDTGPHIVESLVNEPPAQQAHQSSSGEQGNKGKGKANGGDGLKNLNTARQPSVLVEQASPKSFTTPGSSMLPSPPRTSLPRTSAGHPFGQTARDAQRSFEDKEADMEQERQAIIAMEAEIAAKAEAARQAQAKEEAARARFVAEEEARKAREAPILRPPPPAFHATSSPIQRTLTAWSPRQPAALPDVGASQTDNDDTWGVSSPAKIDSDNWGQSATMPGDDTWGGVAGEPETGGTWGNEEVVASPKSIGKANVGGWETPTPAATPKIATSAGSKAASLKESKGPSLVATPAASKAATPAISRKASPSGTPRALSEKALSPKVTPKMASRQATPAATAKATTPIVPSRANSVKKATPAQSPAAASVRSTTRQSSRITSPILAAQPSIAEVLAGESGQATQDDGQDDGWGIPVSDDPVKIEEAIKSPSKVSSRPPSERAPDAPPTPQAASPAVSGHSTPKALTVASTEKLTKPMSLTVAVSEALPGPATPKAATPAASDNSTPKPAAMTSPAASIRSARSAVKSPEAAPTAAWGSPAKSAKSFKSPSIKATSPVGSALGASSPVAKVASPTKPSKDDDWGNADPVVVASPAKSARGEDWGATSPAKEEAWVDSSGSRSPVKSPVVEAAGAWPSSPVKSPAKSVTKSPVKSPFRSEAGIVSPKVKASPAFGLVVSPKSGSATGADTWGAEEHQKTATKGSDPVVVSLAAVAATPAPEPHASELDGTHEHHGEHADGHDDDFGPDDVQVYMDNEPIESGMEIVMDPPPVPFQRSYPKSDPRTSEDFVIDHCVHVAHHHGFDALYQVQLVSTEEEIAIRGYMIHLTHAHDDGEAESSAQWAVASPPAAGATEKISSPSKQTTVKEASEAGWD